MRARKRSACSDAQQCSRFRGTSGISPPPNADVVHKCEHQFVFAWHGLGRSAKVHPQLGQDCLAARGCSADSHMGMVVPDPSLSSTAAAVAAEARVRQFSRPQIGDKLETLRSELTTCGRELQWTQALMQGSSFVDDTLRMLDRLTCRIGVIGQVKAGKSSLVNGLVGKPGLLPT